MATAIVLLVSGKGIRAQEKVRYSTSFVIDSTIDTDFHDFKAIKFGDPLFRQRMMFSELSVAEADIVDAKSHKILFSAGTQFFRTHATKGDIWCLANIRMPKDDLLNTIWGTVKQEYCIVDENSDGIFTGIFMAKRKTASVPDYRGSAPESWDTIMGVRLRPVDPSELKSKYYLEFVYFGGRGGDKPFVRFGQIVKSDRDQAVVGDEVIVPAAHFESWTYQGASGAIERTEKGYRAKAMSGFAIRTLTLAGSECGILASC